MGTPISILTLGMVALGIYLIWMDVGLYIGNVLYLIYYSIKKKTDKCFTYKVVISVYLFIWIITPIITLIVEWVNFFGQKSLK